jgi:hypothetical protein
MNGTNWRIKIYQEANAVLNTIIIFFQITKTNSITITDKDSNNSIKPIQSYISRIT